MSIRIMKETEEAPGLKSYDFVIISKTMSKKIKPLETRIKNCINEYRNIETDLKQILNDTPSQLLLDNISYDSADYHYVKNLLKKVRTAIAAFSGSGS